jgi:hypothetical protein
MRLTAAAATCSLPVFEEVLINFLSFGIKLVKNRYPVLKERAQRCVGDVLVIGAASDNAQRKVQIRRNPGRALCAGEQMV